MMVVIRGEGQIQVRYSESTLQSWTAPLSDSEERRAENSIQMIRSAIDRDDELKTMEIDIFVQGSFANNTNVRTESDVDVCIMLTDVFRSEYPAGKTREDYGFDVPSLDFSEYREMVKRALQAKFKVECVEDGNKSLKIHENTYHVDADVVPAFQLRNYRYLDSVDSNRFIEGTWFVSKDGQPISNYPKRHKQNGTDKNNATNYRYKKLVRIMKHIKNCMVEDGEAEGDKITSFLVECLIYNVPNSTIKGYSTWTETIKQAIIFLYNEIENEKHANWCEVSGMLYLFKRRKWTDQDVKQWLCDVWNYLGY